jgi:hypothetical protein
MYMYVSLDAFYILGFSWKHRTEVGRKKTGELEGNVQNKAI